MKTRKFSFLAALIVSMCAFAQADYGLPERIQDGNILHCFNWSITDVKNNLPDIAEAGFGAVQLSPMQRPSATPGDSWDVLYRPYDLSFQASEAMGTQQDLIDLCAEAKQYGIKIIVDVVANHIDREDGFHLPWWEEGQQARIRKDAGPISYSNRTSITTGLIGDYAYEINTEATAVLQKASKYVKDLASYGVSGIRWDAAKHIGLPSENSNFWSTVTTAVDGMYHYGEILDNPCSSNYGDIVKEYAEYIAVTDTYFSNETAKDYNGIPVRKNGEYAPMVGSDKVVYWAESHDTYSNTAQFGGWSNNVDQNTINRSYASIACRDGATALYLARPGTSGYGNIKLGKTSSGDQDLKGFRNNVVIEVNKFRNLMNGRAEYFSKSEDGKAVSITRYNGGAVIITEPNAQFNVPNGGGYCPVPASTGGKMRDKVSGSQMITVTNDMISGTAGETGVVIIYMNTLGAVQDEDEMIQDFDPIDMTIYYDNSETEWDEVYCYYWGGSSEQSFPGVKMTTAESDGFRTDLFSVTLPIGSHALFNQGSRSLPQTVNSDGSCEANHVYKGLSELDNGKHKIEDTGIYGEEIEEPVSNTYTIYYDNTATQYNPVRCSFDGSTSPNLYPGIEMSPVDDNIYVITIPNDITYVIFNENRGGSQTVNVTNIQDGHIYKGLSDVNDRGRNLVDDMGEYADLTPQPEKKTINVYVYADDSPFLYVWSGNNKPNGNFPGKPMTETVTIGTNLFYCQTFTEDDIEQLESINLILSSEHFQTSNITGVCEDIYISYAGGGKYVIIQDPEGEIEPAQPAPDFITVYYNDINTNYVNSGVISKIFCIYSGTVDGHKIISPSWPGIEMTPISIRPSGVSLYNTEDANLHKVLVPNGATIYFNDGQRNSNQTVTVSNAENNRIYIGVLDTDSNSNHQIEEGDLFQEDKGETSLIENVTVDSSDFDKNIYDLQGIRIEKTIPGHIYIVNGKKILIR